MTTTLQDATLDAVASRKRAVSSPELDAARELVRQAQEQGLSLTGPDGLLKQLTKTVLETALNEELTEHLGHEKHDPSGSPDGNVRNGTRPKTVLTEATGHVQIDVPRDRAGTFTPQIVKKRQRRLTGVDEMVISLYSKGLTTGEISAHFDEIYGASVSKETISRITDKVVEEMQDWVRRPLDEVYAAVFVDAIMVKVRDGQVANRPIYAAIGVTLQGERDVLGLWAGTGGEGAKFWMSVLTDLRNRGVKDLFFVVCDGLKGLPEVVVSVFPLAIVQTCLIHLLRNFPAVIQARLGRPQTRCEAYLHGGQRRRCQGCLRHDGRQLEQPLSGRDSLVGQRLGGVHPILGLRRGDPQSAVQHQRDRELERPISQGCQGPRSFPDRGRGIKVLVSGHPISRSDRRRQDPMGDALEARTQRVRHHLR